MRSLARPAVVAALLLAAACESSPAVVTGTYDGVWNGPLGDGGQISFNVTLSAVRRLDITYPPGACSPWAGWGSYDIAEPILDEGLLIVRSEFTLTGHFQSPTTATGTLQFHYQSSGYDCEPVTWEWTATRS